jgi:hypothetical protein
VKNRVRARKNRRDARYWDDQRRNTPSLGCSRCSELPLCGGLYTSSSAFDCLSYCCGTPDTCTTVCPRNNKFVARVREVSGFELYQIAPTRTRQFPGLPSSIPLIYAKGKRVKPFGPQFAAVSLHQLVDRKLAQSKFRSREELWGYFGLDPSTAIIASGTAKDPVLERWWEIQTSKRIEILKQLSALGIAAITAPNFSVFSDVPRWDNFHDMKRIAICWREILEAGMPAALHVNARATRDWERWADFVKSHTEVDAIAYEFATGAVARFSYHVDELCHLADRVGRPLKLVVRGALPALAQLRKSYAVVSMIDSTTYMRSANRKFAVVRENGVIVWKDAPDRPAVDMDSLTEHNHLTMLKATGEQKSL